VGTIYQARSFLDIYLHEMNILQKRIEGHTENDEK